jgi:hypothetical protein
MGELPRKDVESLQEAIVKKILLSKCNTTFKFN